MGNGLLFLGLVAAAIGAGCGSNVNDGGGGSGAGEIGGGEVGGNAPACVQTHESVEIALTQPDGTVVSCATTPIDAADQKVELDGSVVAIDGGSLTIDTCPPNADCAESIAQVDVIAADLSMPIAVGQLVHVTVEIDMPWDCTSRIAIDNLPTWGGTPNPQEARPVLLLAAGEKTTQTLSPAFSIEKVALGCPDPEELGADTYELLFKAETGSSVELGGGALGTFEISDPSAAATYQVKDVRSFTPGGLDTDWEWAYWVVMMPVLEG